MAGGRSALAIAVSNAGGLGSLPCAMSTPDTIRAELETIRAQTTRPFNVNFFCHVAPTPDASREAAWRVALAPFHREFGIDGATIPAGPGRAPFSHDAADVLEAFRPPVVSFHFGIRPRICSNASCGWGSKIVSSATTVDEVREAHGVDIVIAQGLEAGGHRGIFLSDDLTTQVGTFALLPQVVRAVKIPGPWPAASRMRRASRPHWRSVRPAYRSGPPSCCVPKPRRPPCIAPH